MVQTSVVKPRHVQLRPSVLQIPAVDTEPPSPTYLVALLYGLMCLGACMHGVSMALRKHFGQGKDFSFWLQSRWWIGVIMDAVAGCLVWPAMPVISAEIIWPTVCVLQLGTSYLLGLAVFKEKLDVWRNLGLASAAVGIICINVSTSEPAVRLPMNSLWDAAMNPRFLATNLIVLIVLVLSAFIAVRPAFYALVCAYADGIQFICSKIIADAVFEQDPLLQKQVVCAGVLKVLCLLVVIQGQQMGFRADLSRFSGMYLVSSTVSTVVFGSSFFGEKIAVTGSLVSGIICTLAGIWILSSSEDTDTEVLSEDTDTPISWSQTGKESSSQKHDTPTYGDLGAGSKDT